MIENEKRERVKAEEELKRRMAEADTTLIDA